VFEKEKLTAYIMKSGLSMQQIADKMGIHITTLYRKMNREGDFNWKEIIILCYVLSIRNPEEIFFA